MAEWQRLLDNLFARLNGPFHFRLIMQPLVAAFFAAVDGARDAKLGKPAYFWAIVAHAEERKYLIKEGWKRVTKIFVIAILLDAIYQIKVAHWIYPGETFIVAFTLAVVPYLLLRGPINRLMCLFKHRSLHYPPSNQGDPPIETK